MADIEDTGVCLTLRDSRGRQLTVYVNERNGDVTLDVEAGDIELSAAMWGAIAEYVRQASKARK